MEPPSSPSYSSRFIDRSRLVACRECRRSKIRCSRTFPCDACTRRGCTDICPDGIKQTKRSKSDETLLQENARLVRRIQYLEGILLSLDHPAALSDDLYLDPGSPGPEAQPSERLPSSNLSNPITTHDRDANNLVSLLPGPTRAVAETHGYPHPSPAKSDLTHDPIKALKSQLAQNHASLGPGFQFALRTLLELCRTCGIIDAHDPHDSTPLEESRGTIFSTPSPSSTSPPSSCGPPSDASALTSEIDVSLEHPGLTDSAEHVVWNLSDMMTTTPPSSTDGHRVQLTTLQAPNQFGDTPFQLSQDGAGEPNEPMGSELSQRLFLDLGIMQDTDWRT